MKAKDTLLLNKTTTQNPMLARRAWFWRVASHIVLGYVYPVINVCSYGGPTFNISKNNSQKTILK